MSVQHNLSELFAALKSTKKKDRTIGFESIDILLQQERMIAYLTEGSKDCGHGISWDVLFTNVHSSGMAEVERGAVTPKLLSTITFAISSVKNKARAKINTNTLVCAILAVFTSPNVCSALGKVYLDLASGHLLQHPKYRAEMRCEHWSDLIAMCQQQYINPHPGGSSVKFLELLRKIVKCGIHYSLPPATLLSLLPFYKTILQSDLPPSALFENNLLTLVNITLQGLAADNRLQVVEFVETVYSAIATMYKKGNDLNCHIFNFFNIALHVHHPRGVGPEDILAFAEDWNLWKGQLANIKKICSLEANEIAWSGEKPQYFDDFLTIFADVLHVASLMKNGSEESSVEDDRADSPATAVAIGQKRRSIDVMTQTQKRTKLMSNNTSIGAILAEMTPRDQCFWLSYLEILIKRHPTDLRVDYQHVVQLICNMLCDVRGPPSLLPLTGCAVSLLESSCKDFLEENRKILLPSWLKAGESLIRSVAKDNIQEHHLVLQGLLRSGIMQEVASLLSLYVEEKLDVSAGSLDTLFSLLSLGSVKDEKQRYALLKWCLHDIIVPESTTNLVLSLLVKQYSYSPKRITKYVANYTDIYSAVNLIQEVEADEFKENKNCDNVQLYSNVSWKFIELVKEKMEDILLQINSHDFDKMLNVTNFIEAILRTLSAIWLASVEIRDALLTIVTNLFHEFTSTAVVLLQNKKVYQFRFLSHIFGLDLHPSLRKIIRSSQCINSQLIEKSLELFHRIRRKNGTEKNELDQGDFEHLPNYVNTFEEYMAVLFQNKNEDYRNMFGRGIFVKKQETVLLDVIEFLCQFVQCPASLNNMQHYATSQLLASVKDGSLKVTSPLHLPLIFRIIIMIKDSNEVDVDLLNECLDGLFLICQTKFSETSVLTTSLSILNYLIPIIGKFGNSVSIEMFQKLMEGFRFMLEKRNYAMDTMVLQFLRALVTSSSFQNLGGCSWNNGGSRLFEDIINFLKHSSAKVRLYAAGMVNVVFNFEPSFQSNALAQVKSILSQIPDSNDNYKKHAFAASSLIALAKAFQAAHTIRNQVAYFIVKYISSLHCTNALIENFLKLMSNLLNVTDASKYFKMHLKDLLTHWLREGNSLFQFPYQLLKLNSFNDFCKTYLSIIGAVCFITDNVPLISELASKLSIKTVDIVLEAYPIVKPMADDEKTAILTKMLTAEREEELQTQRLHEIGFAVLRESNSSTSLQVSGCQTFFGYLVENSSAVQQLLLLLEEDIVESIVDEDVTENLKKYVWFVQKYIDQANNYDINCYVLRDSISVTLRILSHQYSSVRMEMCCDLIKIVIEAYINSLRSEIELLLPSISNVLVSVIMQNRPHASAAITLLRYLVVDNKKFLSGAVERLDPFPDEEEFKEINNSEADAELFEEMARFVRVVGHKGRRIAGLTKLLHGLERHKSELLKLYTEAQSVRSSPQLRLLHLVIQQLVQLCSHKDDAVRLEAAKCLGELGTGDLSTLVLKNEDYAIKGYSAPELRLVDQATVLLGQLIQTEALPVKRAACKALYAIMRCDGTVSQLSNFFSPFYTDASSELRLEPKSAFGPPSTVWMPLVKVNHDEWVAGLTIALLDTLSDFRDVCTLLADVCRVHAGFANDILPVIFEVVLTKGTRSLVCDVSRNVNNLLFQQINGDQTLGLKSISVLVETIDHVRKWTWRSGNYRSILNIDLLLVAEAAGQCAAHFTSIFYSEAWFEDQKSAAYDQTPTLSDWNVDEVAAQGDTLSRIMRSAYANIGVDDGLLGCGSTHLTNSHQRLAHLEQLGRWQLVLPLHDALSNTQGVAHSLRNMHFMNTLSHLPLDPQTQITCATRLGDWSCVLPQDSPLSFHFHHYSSLKAFHDNDKTAVLFEIKEATNVVLNKINENQMESSRELYQSLSHLQCLKQLRDVVDLKSSTEIDLLRQKWAHQDAIKPSEFSLMEEVIAARCVIIKEMLHKKDLRMANILGEQYLRLCKLSRKAKRDDINIRNIINLSQLEGVEEDLLLDGKIEEARYFWRKNERSIGTYLLSQLLKSLEGSAKTDLRAKCLRLYGNWMVDTKAENPKVIMEKYFLKSVDYAQSEANKLESYAAIAKFADKNYVQRKEYLESAEFESRQNNITQQNTLVNGLQKTGLPKDREKLQALSNRRKESANDEAEVKNLLSDAQYFLVMALRFYILSLQGGDKYNHFVFRLLSLWLNNMELTDVAILLKDHLPKVPSSKFITLLPQIVPRIHENILLFQTVDRTMMEHPHHTLPFIFALKNSQADYMYCTTTENIKPTPRIHAATAMLSQASKSGELATIINQMKVFTEALIHLANVVIEKARGGTVLPIPPSYPIAKIENLNAVLMPNVDLPIETNLQYKNIVGVQKFATSFELVGGVNAPKKLECVGTDGVKRVLLIKGRDDLRQDAVMQQVFGVINGLLSRNEETRRRKLGMRTYRVVPLSQRSGIIEWCSNTQPIGVYLVGQGASGGAHVKFRPNDLKPSEARSIMAQLAQKNTDTKLDGYLRICSKFRPVLHYFFLEKFHSTGAFFERRLAYIRSVATCSMVGYILGLGDRHLMNMLIDNSTAEVVHIDFGIAFEQGKVLPTPETVPFRLTRDIVDGMGLSGVDGVFRASCEQTMAVLRENKEIIVTLLQVLLYDPLYSWTITPAKALLFQNDEADGSNSNFSSSDSEGKVNAMAERALLRVNSKLQGMEQDGVLTSVEGQVNGLIQQARDPSNLCRLFHGWQAYL